MSELLPQLLTFSRDLLAVFGADERIHEVNARWTEVLGWSREELLGHHFADFVHPDDLSGTHDATVNALRHGEVTTGYSNRYRTKDGRWVWLLWETSELEDGRWLCAGRDITRERETLLEHEALRRVAMAVAGPQTPAEVFAVVSREVGELLHAEAAAVVRLRGGAEVEAVGVWGRVPENLGTGALVMLDDAEQLEGMLARGHAVRVEDREGSSITGVLGFASSVTTPVVIEGREWGLITALHRDPEGLSDADAARLQEFAVLTAMAVAEAAAREELVRRALTDSLTGLMNHRAFLDQLSAELARARRHERPLAVALVDLDRFKAVNDTYGHHVGDAVLRSFADAIRADHRLGDLVGRIGGDEIAIALTDTDAEGAVRALERLREAVQPLEHVSFSAGIAELAEGDTAEAVLRRADALLYKSKREGRARTSASD